MTRYTKASKHETQFVEEGQDRFTEQEQDAGSQSKIRSPQTTNGPSVETKGLGYGLESYFIVSGLGPPHGSDVAMSL